MTVTARKRAFIGMAGSPLAKILKQVVQKSDHTLRIPKTPDREDPTPFEVWIDAFGQKHGQIDLDCAFQNCAFDPHLGRGASPNVDSERSGRSHDDDDDDSSPKQDLGNGPTARIITGLLEGEREIKKRKPTAKSWWVFNGKLFREFLQLKFDSKNRDEAEKAALVLYLFYFQNRQDEDILKEPEPSPTSFSYVSFDNVKQVKQYRQFLIREGAERFKDLKPESTWHGRRAFWRGFGCNDPDCSQCKGNEISLDYSGRSR